MPILKIQTGADNPILRTKSLPVREIDAKIKKLAKNMADTLAKKDGLGLAAPQVGESIRLIIVRLNVKTSHETQIIMINPEITVQSDEEITEEEGCLSLPGKYRKIARAKEITVQFETLEQQKLSLKLENLNARMIQHEIDHLNGVLIVDYA